MSSGDPIADYYLNQAKQAQTKAQAPILKLANERIQVILDLQAKIYDYYRHNLPDEVLNTIGWFHTGGFHQQVIAWPVASSSVTSVYFYITTDGRLLRKDSSDGVTYDYWDLAPLVELDDGCYYGWTYSPNGLKEQVRVRELSWLIDGMTRLARSLHL